MIHATRPFVLNEWIQTKIEGYEVSGTVEVNSISNIAKLIEYHIHINNLRIWTCCICNILYASIMVLLSSQHVGWWSPTIIRGDDREAVYIPNHKFTVSVVRNLTQKNHWRIKTHLAISHLDVNKINVSTHLIFIILIYFVTKSVFAFTFSISNESFLLAEYSS